MSFQDTIARLIDAARLWVRTTSFAEYVPAELQSAAGYRTDATDTRVADAILDLWQRSRFLPTFPTGKRILAAMAGCSPNAAAAAVKRLEGWFSCTVEDEAGYIFMPGDLVVRRLTTLQHEEQAMLHSGQSTHDEPPAADPNLYTPNRRDDVFMAGTSKTVKTWAKEMSPDAGQTWREWLQENTQAGLGETALRIVDALGRAGDMTAAELAEETSKKIGSIRRAAHRLETLTVIEVDRESSRAPKTYSLPPEWRDKIEELRPTLRTYQIGDCREDSRLEQAQCWTERQLSQARTQEQRDAAHQRKERLAARRAKILARLHPTLPAAMVKTMAADVPVKQWTQRRAALAAMAKMNQERDAALTASREALAETWRQVADLPAADQRRMLTLAGYDAGDMHRMRHAASMTQ